MSCAGSRFKLGLNNEQISQFVTIMAGSYKAFIENDFALFEVNPLQSEKIGV